MEPVTVDDDPTIPDEDAPVRVLHVDDDRDVAELTAEFLERERDHLTVLTATSGREGLDVLAEADVDCVVSDYDMPGMDGLTFLEAVRDAYPDLPFLLFTGKGSEEIASDAISAGVTDYLQKGGGREQYAVLANRISNAVDRRRSRLALQAAREQFRTLVEEATDAIFVVDETGTFRYVTPAVERILGFAPDELVGEAGFDRVHPEDTGRVQERFFELVEDPGEPLTAEFRYRHADGSWTWIEVRGRNLLDSRVRGIVVYAREVTARKEQERRLETLVSNLPGVAYRCANEPGWPMEFVRGECQALTGYPASAFEDGAVSWGEDLIVPADRGRVWETVQAALDRGEAFEVSYEIESKDGDRKWVWERGRGVRSADGELEAIEGFVSDVTDRVEHERELEERERKFRAVFEEAFDAIVVADAEGSLVDANPAAAELFGVPLEELLGRSIEEFAPSDYDFAAAWEEFTGSDRERGTFPLVREDGTRRTVEYAATADIVPGRHLSIIRDVTDRRRRERQLRRQATQFRGFGSIVAHDLRTPLNTAVGRLGLARETGDAEHFDAAERALTRLTDLVDDLAGAMREGELVTELDDVDLGRCLRSVWGSLGAPPASLEVADAPTVRADEAALSRLLENLLKNVLDHAGEDATVRAGSLVGGFFVEDDGPGIPPEERDEVFEPGYTSGGDTGFGLVSVQQIALAHGWGIEVTEGEDGGARFEFADVEVV